MKRQLGKKGSSPRTARYASAAAARSLTAESIVVASDAQVLEQRLVKLGLDLAARRRGAEVDFQTSPGRRGWVGAASSPRPVKGVLHMLMRWRYIGMQSTRLGCQQREQ